MATNLSRKRKFVISAYCQDTKRKVFLKKVWSYESWDFGKATSSYGALIRTFYVENFYSTLEKEKEDVVMTASRPPKGTGVYPRVVINIHNTSKGYNEI